MSLTSSDAG